MKTSKVLLVEDSPDYSSLVLQWLCGDPNQKEFALIWTDSLASALSRLQKGGIDLILMDLGLPDSEGLETFTALKAQEPELPIFVLSGDDNHALALQTIKLGAEDYLVKSGCTAEILIRMLRHGVVRHQLGTIRNRTQESASLARVIGVVGGAGGAGVTTVACVLAAELHQQTAQPTLLLDLDSNPGMVSFAMGIDPPFTVRDVMENTSRLDWSFWEGVVFRREAHPDILASPRSLAEREPDIENLRKIVSFATNYYRWIVMDLGRMSRTARQLLTSTSDVVLVSTQNIPALHQCRHAIGILHDLGIDKERIRLIVNKMHADERLSKKELESVIDIPAAAILPPSSNELWEANLQRSLPPANSGFRRVLSGLARSLAGIPEAEATNPLLSNPLTSLKSLAERLRPKNAVLANGLRKEDIR